MVYLRQDNIYDIEVDDFANYLSGSVFSANSGKSMAGFAETAHAATGIPITRLDGHQIPDKYPRTEPLLIWIIGYDQGHIGRVVFPMLFEPGAFKIIRDLKTRQWRAWRPWENSDKERQAECKPSDPLIPPRFIDPAGWAWESKSDRVFTKCRLKNGNQIHAMSSKAEPAQGVSVHLIHIDEDVYYPRHLAEWQSRLAHESSKLFWTAFPHSANFALMDLSKRANEQATKTAPDVHETRLVFVENPYIDADQKRQRLDDWDHDTSRARNLGEFLTDNVLVYPNFSKRVHGITDDPALVGDIQQDRVQRELAQKGWQPPQNWTRYLVLDPGHSTCAVLFAAVPPPEFGDYVIAYDELYIHNADARACAEGVYSKTVGQYFEAFIIDDRAGRHTPMGFGQTVKSNYSNEFERMGLRSNRTGHNFLRGSDNVAAGIASMRAWLTMRTDGLPKFRCVLATTPNLQREFGLYLKKVTKDESQEDPNRHRDHLMDCCRYLAAYNPQHVVPEPEEARPGSAFAGFQDFTSERKMAAGRQSVVMGPGAA